MNTKHNQKNESTSSVLMHDKTELLRGDHTTISIVYRNLTGENPTSPGYKEMMDEQFELKIDPTKLWIERPI